MLRDVITRKEALAAGFSEDAISWRLSRGQWQLLFRNVYFTRADPPAWEQQMFAACQWAGPEVVASFGAAGRLFKLPGFEAAGVELTTTRDLRSRPGVVIHHLGNLDKRRVTKIGRIPVTTPTWTIVNLSAVVEFPKLQSVVDYSICQELTTWQRLENAVQASAGEKGVTLLREILRDRQTAESELQRAVARSLVGAGLQAPLLEYPEGRYRIDLAYPEDRLAIETDGYGTHSSRQAFGEDRVKQNHLVSLGWRVLRFTWDDLVSRPAYIIETVTAFLRRPPRSPRTGNDRVITR